jgi:peptidoglycan-associated lipoprotein
MHRYSRAAFVVILLALSVAACRKKQPEVVPAATTTTTTTGDRGGSGPVTTSTPPVTRIDSTEHFKAIEVTKTTLAGAIYFDYDAAELSTTARAQLDTKAQIMRDNPTIRIRIEGNCDERGSNEYNIALGQRRAAAAREYLVNRGIAASRIETVSLGEEKPAMQGGNEAAWSKNRRDEFVTIAGTIVKPLSD